MTARTLTLRGDTYPVVLPSIRDPRLHVAAVIITVHVLGQVALNFRVSIPQILAAILTCAVLEVALTFRSSKAFVWPASAMLTGSGVALILRLTGQAPNDHWTFDGWYVFATVAGLSLLSKYVIRYRGNHIFNPSNIGLVVAFLVLGMTRVEPLDFWWGPLDLGLVAAYAVILIGGHADHAPTQAAGAGGDVLGGTRRGPRPACRIGPLHDGELGVRAGLRGRLLAGDRDLARGPDLPVLHDHRPEDRAGRPGRPRHVRAPRRGRVRAADGAADRRVVDEGRAPVGPGPGMCGSTPARPGCPRTEVGRGRPADVCSGARPCRSSARRRHGPSRRRRDRARRYAGARGRRPRYGRIARRRADRHRPRDAPGRSPSRTTWSRSTTSWPGPGCRPSS